MPWPRPWPFGGWLYELVSLYRASENTPGDLVHIFSLALLPECCSLKDHCWFERESSSSHKKHRAGSLQRRALPCGTFALLPLLIHTTSKDFTYFGLGFVTGIRSRKRDNPNWSDIEIFWEVRPSCLSEFRKCTPDTWWNLQTWSINWNIKTFTNASKWKGYCASPAPISKEGAFCN